MYIVEDGYSKWFGSMFFSILIIICSYFLLNLTVAVMLDNFSQLSRRDNEVEELIEDYYFNHFKTKYAAEGKPTPEAIADLPPLDIERVRKQIKEAMAQRKKKRKLTCRQKIVQICQKSIYKNMPQMPKDKYYEKKFKRWTYMIVNIPAFNTFIYGCILANTVILAMDRYPSPS